MLLIEERSEEETEKENGEEENGEMDGMAINVGIYKRDTQKIQGYYSFLIIIKQQFYIYSH